jgi:chloramphenicol O-acetyltransferase type A
MKEIVVGNRQKINLETWERRAAFHFFKDFTEPYHGVCLRVDCTATYHYAKQHRLSVFLSLLHRSLVAAHQVENLRTRIVDGAVWLYEQINGGSAVGRANGTIGMGHYQFRSRIGEFVREAAIELDRVRQRDDIERYPEANLIRYSVLPWFDFTSISHARDFSGADSARGDCCLCLAVSQLLWCLKGREEWFSLGENHETEPSSRPVRFLPSRTTTTSMSVAPSGRRVKV